MWWFGGGRGPSREKKPVLREVKVLGISRLEAWGKKP